MKLSITDQAKDQAISSELNELVQTLFDRFMKDSKKKITRIWYVINYVYNSGGNHLINNKTLITIYYVYFI